jgi:DeoR/GlpR family transcriptional regulator of sugar metabolism
METEAETRRAVIIEELAQAREIKVTSLSERFGVSEVMIRRDLERLERHGLLKRVRGGAIALPRAIVGEVNASDFRDHAGEKERIGAAAAALVRPGEHIILDSGTTVLQLARHLPGDLLSQGNLTVVTNSLHIVRELGPWAGVQLLLLGGIYLPQYDIVVGPKTVSSLRELRVDKTFLGAKGLTLARGITTSNVLEAEADRAAVEAAHEVILLADSSKFGVDSLVTLTGLDKIHKLITDVNAPPSMVAALEERGIEVIMV